MKAVILQPMYLPWMGYFGMIEQADVFVFYDDVQFNRDSWHQRNRIKVPESDGSEEWLKVPVIEDFGQKIENVEIQNQRDWKEDHWSSIQEAYSEEPIPYGKESAPYFEEYEEIFSQIYSEDWENLAELNIKIIKEITEILGFKDTEFIRSSNLEKTGSGTEKLINVLKEIEADEYISGPGAKDYLDLEMFKENGIALYWHKFSHPEYSQLYGDFNSHMSIIDLIFNEGEASASIIKDAEQESLEKEV